MIWAEWQVGVLSVILADQIPYTQFGKYLKFQKKVIVLLPGYTAVGSACLFDRPVQTANNTWKSLSPQSLTFPCSPTTRRT